MVPAYHWQINGTNIPLADQWYQYTSWLINGTSIPLADQWCQYTIGRSMVPIYQLVDQWYQYTSWLINSTNIPLADQWYQYTIGRSMVPVYQLVDPRQFFLFGILDDPYRPPGGLCEPQSSFSPFRV